MMHFGPVLKAVLALAALAALAACATATPPPVDDATTITLTRSACFGFCPIYSVRLTGAGEVTYVGERFVNVTGEQHATVAREDVAELLARFDAIGFESLRGEYRARITDIPTYTLTLARDGRSKTVIDYGGVSAGMPQAVRALEDEVDRVAGTARWVLRDGQPVRGGKEH